MVDGLGKNYANLQAVVNICQLFISELSTVIDSTNQILIPGTGIMERRHQWNVYRLPCDSLLTRPLSVHPVRPRLHSAISNGSLFAGYCICLQSDMKFERSAIEPETTALSLRIVVVFFLAVRLKLNILEIDSQNIRVRTPLKHAFEKAF